MLKKKTLKKTKRSWKKMRTKKIAKRNLKVKRMTVINETMRAHVGNLDTDAWI